MADRSVEAPAQGGGTGRSLKDSSAIVIVTFLIAVLGAVTGTISFFRGVRVDIRLTARYGIAQPYGSLQVGIVNHSAQGVSIVGGAILFDGRAVARVVKVMPTVPALGDPRPSAEIFATAQELPYAIGPGESLAGTVLLSDSRIVPQIRYPYSSPLPDILHQVEANSDRIRLRLDFTPGGSRDTSVQLPSVVVRESKDPDHLPGWHSQLRLDRHARVVRIMIYHNTTELGLSTFQLWKAQNPKPIFETTQPISQTKGADFYLPALPSGKYDWAVEVNGRIVAVGNFTQPCRVHRSMVSPSDCTYKS